MVDSEKQEITNPQYKQKQGLLARLKTQLNKSYKKFSKSKEVFNKGAHAFHAVLEIVAVDAVAIANEKTQGFFVWEGVDDLLGGPSDGFFGKDR